MNKENNNQAQICVALLQLLWHISCEPQKGVTDSSKTRIVDTSPDFYKEVIEMTQKEAKKVEAILVDFIKKVKDASGNHSSKEKPKKRVVDLSKTRVVDFSRATRRGVCVEAIKTMMKAEKLEAILDDSIKRMKEMLWDHPLKEEFDSFVENLLDYIENHKNNNEQNPYSQVQICIALLQLLWYISYEPKKGIIDFSKTARRDYWEEAIEHMMKAEELDAILNGSIKIMKETLKNHPLEEAFDFFVEKLLDCIESRRNEDEESP